MDLISMNRLLEECNPKIDDPLHDLLIRKAPCDQCHVGTTASFAVEGFDEFHAVHKGHVVIRDDDAGTRIVYRTLEGFIHIERAFRGVGVRDDLVASTAEDTFQHRPNRRIIIKDHSLHILTFFL